VAEQDDERLEERLELGEGWTTARVAFARIEALTIQAASLPQQVLHKALVPGTRIERHRRVWRMGQVRREGRSLVGRIGFEAPGLAELWDDEIADFKETERPAGTTSPFAIDSRSFRVAFQLRPGLIRAKSFTGALQALMNAADPVDRWRVFQELETVPFAEWVESVDRILSLRIRLERPNPHYADRERVRALIEGANARMAEIVLNADPEDLQGLDISDPFIVESIEHANEHGGYSALAETRGERTQWSSPQEGAAETRIVEADPKTHDVSHAALRQQLGDTADTASSLEQPTEPGDATAGA
jgi:hypothetical protein